MSSRALDERFFDADFFDELRFAPPRDLLDAVFFDDLLDDFDLRLADAMDVLLSVNTA